MQRHKLTELQALLGLSDSLWTPVGVLGFVLAAASCHQLEELRFFKVLGSGVGLGSVVRVGVRDRDRVRGSSRTPVS